MEPTFPLFRLPENAIVQVLQNMDPDWLLIISLISTKIKHIVTSLLLKAGDVEICISDMICLKVHIGRSLLALNFYNDSNDQNELLSVDITLPVDAFLPLESKTIQSSTPLNFSNWLNHIQSVFCYTNPLNLDFHRYCERFEIQSLKDAIGNVDVLYVTSGVTNVFTKEVLKFFNASNNLFLERNPFKETHQIQQILIQNYTIIGFHDVYSLDDMLLVNIIGLRWSKMV
ncbi:hypothetical protein CRE_06118 [Caenorhabditis remanei]|uniref:F-box domain-containing protein n=1 Tax=Caenorhabditis remanei TaxID=31234 RepID=E3NEE4_CAERE|nr:hypothetical protein CRE_06118 [Caenorhabditis remanei]